jgi:hypothetical protein
MIATKSTIMSCTQRFRSSSFSPSCWDAGVSDTVSALTSVGACATGADTPCSKSRSEVTSWAFTKISGPRVVCGVSSSSSSSSFRRGVTPPVVIDTAPGRDTAVRSVFRCKDDGAGGTVLPEVWRRDGGAVGTTIALSVRRGPLVEEVSFAGGSGFVLEYATDEISRSTAARAAAGGWWCFPSMISWTASSFRSLDRLGMVVLFLVSTGVGQTYSVFSITVQYLWFGLMEI